MHTGLPAAPMRQTPSAIRDDRFTRCPFPAATTDAPVAPVRSSNTAMEQQNFCTDLRHPELLAACCPYSSVQGKLVVQHPSRTKKVGKLPPLRGFSVMRPYYLVPDGKVGHDAFAVIRETIRSMNKVAIGRVVLTNREHIISLEALDSGLMGTLLRYPYEVRSEKDYFDDIQDVKLTKDMLDLAKHIVTQKTGTF